MVAFIRSFYVDWDDAHCNDLLHRFRLSDSDAIGTLSTGSKMKLNFVVAMAHRPAVLLLDEPLIGLDPLAKHEVFKEMMEAVRDESRTVFISSHNLDELERYADHIGLIDDGRMRLEGPTVELVDRFKMMDCTAGSGFGPPSRAMNGVYVQKQDQDRVRVLVDTLIASHEKLEYYGLAVNHTAPVTLEEIYVGLMRRG